MREEEEPSWFARGGGGEEQQLPRPDELMPLTQTLITPDLAVAFDIATHGGGGAGAAAGGAGGGSATDAATEHLFATGPVPFLPPGHHRAPPAADAYPPFSPMGAAHHHHHQHHAPQIGHFHHPAGRPLAHHYGGAAGFDHGFLSRVAAPPVGPAPGMHHHRMVSNGAGMGMMAPGSFADEMDLGSRGAGGSGGRRELTLFPTSGDH